MKGEMLFNLVTLSWTLFSLNAELTIRHLLQVLLSCYILLQPPNRQHGKMTLMMGLVLKLLPLDAEVSFIRQS